MITFKSIQIGRLWNKQEPIGWLVSITKIEPSNKYWIDMRGYMQASKEENSSVAYFPDGTIFVFCDFCEITLRGNQLYSYL